MSSLEKRLHEYFDLANKNEELKSEERILDTMRANLSDIKQLLIETEIKFCDADRGLRAPTRQSLLTRCSNLIDHLVHYKCVIECLATDMLNLDSNLLNDDEYVSLSLTYRQAELALLSGIRKNQQRHEMFASLEEEDAPSFLSNVEPEWRMEHDERRKFIKRLILDQAHFVADKTAHNLDQQQVLLNQRYQSINTLIKMSL